MYVDIEKLISVVRSHSVLYDNSTKEYYDRIKKKLLWDEVCVTLNPDWETSDVHKKTVFGKEVQKKWQSLRDCFRRELVNQKTAAISGKKKATYKYFEQLKFLTPFTQSVTDTTEQDDVSIIEEIESSNSKDPLDNMEVIRKRKRCEDDFPVIKERNARYLDDDEAFLMSLLPGFKEYNQEQKYMLRIDIMNTILKFKQNQTHGAVTMKCEESLAGYDDSSP